MCLAGCLSRHQQTRQLNCKTRRQQLSGSQQTRLVSYKREVMGTMWPLAVSGGSQVAAWLLAQGIGVRRMLANVRPWGLARLPLAVASSDTGCWLRKVLGITE